jgi:hypothetical protein
MALSLAALPPSYALLHDLRLPGSKGNIDHLVIGPGGAFVVVIRSCSEKIEYRDGQLWTGEQSLRDVLTAAQVESQLLTQSLRTPVVAVVALLDVVLPAATPPKVDGVLVCSGDLVVRVVTRGSHTLLPPHQVAELTERALPLLHDGRSFPRTESALGVRAETSPDLSVSPMVPALAPASAQSVKRRHDTQQAAKKGRRSDSKPKAAPARGATREPIKEKSGRSRSARFVAAALVAMCVLAIGFGSLVSLLWGGGEAPADGLASTSTEPVVTSAEAAHISAVVTTQAVAMEAPAVEFIATCTAPGTGWALTPVWPGDRDGLKRYEIEIENLDATWRSLPSLDSASTQWSALAGQVPRATYRLRMTAVMNDAERVTSAPTLVIAPETAC